MIYDLDILRSANELIKQHGDEAGLVAALRADAMLDKGDLEGQRVWLRIAKAIDELTSVKEGETQH